MNLPQVKYRTLTRTLNYAGKTFVLEVIRNLDEAIDQLCQAMDEQQKLDPFAEDLCPYFGVLWPAAEALAQFLALNPALVRNKKVLELGCGAGLPSLLASHLGGKVLATDFHPEVEGFFSRNCRQSSIECEYQRLNWRETEQELKDFDVVIGSDVLYESKHPLEVARGMLRFLKPGGKVILSDPGRAYLQKFLDAMTELGHAAEMELIKIGEKEVFVFCFESTECTG